MSTESEHASDLWDCPPLSPPCELSRLGKHDLADWRSRLDRAIRRHEYLRSLSGQQMTLLSIQQSIARLRAAEQSFTDWLEHRSSESLTRLQKMLKRVDDEVAARVAKSQPKRWAVAGPSARKLALAEELCSDSDIRALIVKKHGSVEAYAQTL